MRNLQDLTADEMVGLYGPTYREGVLSEHADLFLAAGGTIRNAVSLEAAWAILPDGRAYPVLCSDLARIDTEDGPEVGRCGQVAGIDGQCEGHEAESAGWLAMSEAERAAWERQHDALTYA